ncbi:MAG TPA: addiction module protein [Pirellulaceae bacterium]|nr:addiction module protein [Pirellulaceae bacterium]
MSNASLPPEIRELPVAQRLDLVERIWDSIVEDGDFTLSDAQQTELDRRLAARAAAPNRGSSWDDVKARLLGDR